MADAIINLSTSAIGTSFTNFVSDAPVNLGQDMTVSLRPLSSNSVVPTVSVTQGSGIDGEPSTAISVSVVPSVIIRITFNPNAPNVPNIIRSSIISTREELQFDRDIRDNIEFSNKDEVKRTIDAYLAAGGSMDTVPEFKKKEVSRVVSSPSAKDRRQIISSIVNQYGRRTNR